MGNSDRLPLCCWRTILRRGVAMLIASWFLAAQMVVGLEPTPRPKLTATDIERGRTLFQGQGGFFRGGGGDGGRGANLARPTLRRAPTDEALFRVINRGVPSTGMP